MTKFEVKNKCREIIVALNSVTGGYQMVERRKKCWGWTLQGYYAITMDKEGKPQFRIYA
jgi:hypothetical protein